MTSIIAETAYRFKAALLAQEQQAMETMARRWLGVMDRLDGDIAALSEEVTRLGLRNPDRIMRLARYQRLMTQAYQEFQRYEAFAGDLVANNQSLFARLGVDYGLGLMQEAGRGVALTFDRIPVEAVRFTAGIAGDGSPLTALFNDVWPDVAERMTQSLVNGIALGQGAQQVARALRAATNMGLNRSLLIARSESMRVYREASLTQYRSSSQVEGFQRVAAHDSRVCAACLLDEGTVYALADEMPEHPQGRCLPIPVLVRRGPNEWTRGETWLAQQNEARQIAILGKARRDAWQMGQIRLSDIPQRVENPTWGPTLRARPIGEMSIQ
jgi:SPP1 gp7 family putative phage head morphogenesis protein